jgi:hypothetical protein
MLLHPGKGRLFALLLMWFIFGPGLSQTDAAASSYCHESRRHFLCEAKFYFAATAFASYIVNDNSRSPEREIRWCISSVYFYSVSSDLSPRVVAGSKE